MTPITPQSITQLNEQLRELIVRYAGPKDKKDETPIVQHELIHCVDSMLTVAAIFKSLETCHPGFVFVAIQSLLWGLPRNLFWKQHSETLLPLINSGFNSYLTYLRLKGDMHVTPEKTELAEQQRRVWISIFPACVGCMWGGQRMLDESPAMLQELYRIL